MNLVVRVDRQEILTELLVLRDVDRVNLVGDAEFLQQDRDFPAVRCAPGIELDGHWDGSSSGFPVVQFHSSIRTDHTRLECRKGSSTVERRVGKEGVSTCRLRWSLVN